MKSIKKLLLKIFHVFYEFLRYLHQYFFISSPPLIIASVGRSWESFAASYLGQCLKPLPGSIKTCDELKKQTRNLEFLRAVLSPRSILMSLPYVGTWVFRHVHIHEGSSITQRQFGFARCADFWWVQMIWFQENKVKTRISSFLREQERKRSRENGRK